MIICLWNKCNCQCMMCTNPIDFGESNLYTQDFVKRRIEGIGQKLKENEEILFTGGEPTIHPQFLEILKFTRNIYPNNRIEVLSNGRRFAYKDFTYRVMQMPNLTLMISLAGYNSETHNKVTCSQGSFQQTIEGMNNIFSLLRPSLDQKVEIRIVITKINYKYLTKILDLVKKKFFLADRVILIFLEIEGRSKENFSQVGLTYKQFKPYLKGIYPYFSKFRELRLYHFPLCVLPSKFWPHVWRTLPEEEVAFPPSCKRCLYKEHCLGIHEGYLETVGAKEFKPLDLKFKLKLSDNFHRPILDIK